MSWNDNLDAVLRAAHSRLSRDPEARSFQVELESLEERDALADLLGWATRPGIRVRVPLSGPNGLASAVDAAARVPLLAYLEQLFGELRDPGFQRRQAQTERQALWEWWTSHPALQQRPALESWANDVVRLGARGGTGATRALLERTLLVLDELPTSDELLPVLAGRLLNDTHALDSNTPLASLVLGAVAAEQGAERPADTAGRRELWRSVGVRDDDLSSTVLVAGMRPQGDSTVAQLCRQAAPSGEALSLTLAQVRQPAGAWNASRVFVVENPAVVALAVREFGRRTPPLVCGSGWPSTAVTELLGSLASGGAAIQYHGDLDGEGVRITAHLIDLVGVLPWRMGTTDYLDCVADHGAQVGRVTDAPWDSNLAPAMREKGIAVLEETVWGRLRDDMEASLPEYPGTPTRRGIRRAPPQS